MWIVWLAVGTVIGWLIPQPQVTWAPTGEKMGLIKWVTRKVKQDVIGMN